MREALKGIADIERIAGRIALFSARPRDLSGLRDGLARLDALRARWPGWTRRCWRSCTRNWRRPAPYSTCSPVPSPPNLDQPARRRRHRPGYDADLDELRGIQDNCGEFLLALEAREKERTGIASLKVEYNRVHGFYIEVTHANVDKIPEDYRRRQTLKNAERYITPELKAFEDKALSAQDRRSRARSCWDEILSACSRRFRACWRSPAPSRSPICSPPSPTSPPSATIANRNSRRAGRADRRRPPPGGREPDRRRRRVIHRQRHKTRRRQATAADHRPEHGRQIDLHAADGTDRVARPHRRLRAGDACALGPLDQIFTRIGPPTTSPPAARPSWSR